MARFFEEFTTNIETNIFLTAAKQTGWKVTVLLTGDYSIAEIEKNNLRYRISDGTLSVNSSVSTQISRDKYLTNLMLAPHTPYVTQPQKFLIEELKPEIYQQLLSLYGKLVVKPLDENNGIGVTTSLTTVEQVVRAVEKVKNLGAKNVLIENHVPIHREYRVMLWKGQAMDVLQRIPAYVVGDGSSTIQSLIEQKNQYRVNNFGSLFELINMDEDLNMLLQEQNLDLTTVLPAEKYLTVETTCNLSQGGEVKRIELETLHPEFKAIFAAVYQATWLNYCGLDLITPDVTQAPVSGQTVINELNGAPGMTLAFFDDVATNRPFLGALRTLERLETDPVQLFL
jgi:cyanophycin synthetase